jgi:hypothetical protein
MGSGTLKGLCHETVRAFVTCVDTFRVNKSPS